jgi:hypothetical protein
MTNGLHTGGAAGGVGTRVANTLTRISDSIPLRLTFSLVLQAARQRLAFEPTDGQFQRET